MQEKEAHLVSLTKELSETKDRFFATNFEEKIGDVVPIDRFLEMQNYLEEEKKRCRSLELRKDKVDNEFDDLTFKLDEAEMKNVNLETELVDLRNKFIEVLNKIYCSFFII